MKQLVHFISELRLLSFLSGGALPALFFVALMALVSLPGCSSNDTRTVIVGTHETIRALANAAAQAYAVCVRGAQTAAAAAEDAAARADAAAAEERCHLRKQSQARELRKAEPFLRSATTAVITADQVAADGSLRQARRLLFTVRLALSDWVDPTQKHVVEWLE
ncbi:MAG: hypothetical protein AAGG11_24115 [Pseudomonadota bacterium]